MGVGWSLSAWAGNATATGGVVDLQGTDPWTAAVFSSAVGSQATTTVSAVTVRYRAPSGPVQILVFAGDNLVGTKIIDGGSSESRTATVAWSELGSPASISRIAIQEASGAVGQLQIEALTLTGL